LVGSALTAPLAHSAYVIPFAFSQCVIFSHLTGTLEGP